VFRFLPFSPILFGVLAAFIPLHSRPASSVHSPARAFVDPVYCTPADFDASLQFFNGPESYFTIILDERVISSQPCVFDHSIPAPSFIFNQTYVNPPFVTVICQECDDHLPEGQHLIFAPTVLNPDQHVQQTIRWKTSPASDAESCSQPNWMEQPVVLTTPILLKKVCSNIEFSRFRIITSPVPAPPQDQPQNDGHGPAFMLTSSKSSYYARESFDLHVSLAQPNLQSPPKQGSCPTLFMKQRSPDGRTRIDEVRPVVFKGCRTFTLGREHESGDWDSGFNLDSGASSLWEGLGEHSMQVFQLIASADDPQIHLAPSNVLRIQIADPALIARKWGPREKGVAVDLTLDKDTYRLGEDVPLHMAIEDFDAEVPIFSWDPLWDPCAAINIEVQDTTGRPLPQAERFPRSGNCMGHGIAPGPFPKGKPVPIEWTLSRMGWLPNHPGTYAVVVTWGPSAAADNTARYGVDRIEMKSYAVVHGSATIHILEPGAAQTK
jgi:hypothetical protein